MDCFRAGKSGSIAAVDRLQTMKVFARVAQAAGFARAARDLRMTAGAVSKHVSALEEQVGVRLFDRTTRRVALTEAGRIYLERCLECLQALDDADASVSELARAPRGLLRVTAPIDFGEQLMPVLGPFMVAQPGIVVDLRLSNRVVDLVEEGVDVAIRVAPALDGRYVARPLARSRLAIFASPDYLERHGRPKNPQELASHRCLVFAEPRPMDELPFTRGRRKMRVKLNTVMTTNSGDAFRHALLQGIGLGALPSFLAQRDMGSGRIEPILSDWLLPEFQIFAVYPHRRFVSPKLRLFIEALRAELGDGTRDPWWPGRHGGSAAAG
jgi:DNA-binding transcriptional LysR family regulator